MKLYTLYEPNILKRVHFYLTMVDNNLKKVYILSFRVLFRHLVKCGFKF